MAILICRFRKPNKYYHCDENKGADQLCGKWLMINKVYCEADLRICFHICKTLFSNDADESDKIKMKKYLNKVRNVL